MGDRHDEHPVAKAILNRFPNPNADPATLGGNRNYSTATPQVRNFREELPRHPTGKLYKRLLKDEYWQGHGKSRII